jgi:tetratricopeptide (TPR) repeat protein
VAGLIGLAPAEAPQEEAFRAVRRAFELMASERPLVVVFDDIHWAQPAFLDLIDHLADWSRDAPILLICLARQELLEARPAWGGGKHSATTIQLEPLSDDESEALIANLLGSAGLEAEAGRRIAAAAEGNPLFVEEMLEMLIDDGLLVRRNSHWEPDGDLTRVAVPPTIQALLAARLERLGPDERSVMERGAVEGKVFHRGAVLELAPDPVRSAVTSHLMALVRKELVRPDRPTFAGEEAFRFRHLLIRDAAYQAMPKETRAELHERFAGWLERVAGDRVGEYEEIVAYHLEQAFRYREELGPVDGAARGIARRASEHLAAAGMRAEARGDAVATRSLLARATALLPEGDPDGLRLQPKLGRAMFEAGEIEAAGELLDRAADEAERAGDRSTAARARVTSMVVGAALGVTPVNEVIEQAKAAMAAFEELGDEAGVVSAAGVLGQFLFFRGNAAESAAILTTASRRADAAGLQGEVFEATWWLMAALFFGPVPASECEERLREAEARTRGSRTAEAAFLRASARLQTIQGRFDEARANIRTWEEIERELGRAVRLASIHGHYLGPLEMAAGRYPEAVEACRRGFEAQASLGDRGFSATVAGVLAHALLMVGDHAEAERFAREALSRSAADDLEPKLSGNGALGVALARQGHVADGERHARLAVELARGTDYSMTLADALIDVAEVVAIDGRRDEGVALVDEAIAVLERKEAWALVDRAREARDAL